MKTDKEKIIAYMKSKRKKLFELTYVSMYVRADYAEIRKLSDEKCEDIWKKLSLKDIDARCLCPQCVLINDYCDGCNYSQRHGRCGQSFSDWSNLCVKLPEGTFIIPKICHPIIDKLNKEKP